MTKRIVFLLVLVFSICLCTCCLAIGNSDNYDCDNVEYKETGIATFLMDNAGRLSGVLKPQEDIKKLGFQTPKRNVPKDLEDGKAIRRHAYVRVCLNDELKVIKGGKDVKATLILTNLKLVESLLGENFSIRDVVDATIYSPDICSCKPHAAHMFLPQNSGRENVGKIIFECGGYLDLYVGDFDKDCELELGFRAVAVKGESCPQQVEGCIEPQDPCGSPCLPVCPNINITTTTTVTTTTNTTITFNGGCKPKK